MNNLKKMPDLNKYSYLNEGSCALIYKKDKEVLKVYKSECNKRFRISKNLFEIIQELDLNNVVKLFNYYFDDNKITFNSSINGYSMQYINDDKTNILLQKSEYLLDVINSLEKTCLKLAKSNISIHDAYHSNIIFNKDGAYLIDVDMYKINKIKNLKKIYLHNQKELLNFLKSKMLYDDIDEALSYSKLSTLFDFNLKGYSITDCFNILLNEDTVYKSLKKYDF